MLFQRGETVLVPIDIESEPDFRAAGAFLVELRADAREPLHRRLRRCLIFLPVDRVRIARLPFRVFDRGMELPFQRADRVRQFQLRPNEDGLEKPNDAQCENDAPHEQHAPQPRPAFTARILENKALGRARCAHSLGEGNVPGGGRKGVRVTGETVTAAGAFDIRREGAAAGRFRGIYLLPAS